MNARALLLAPGVQAGALAGLAVALVFLFVHAQVIEPIWIRGLVGVPPAVLGGALLGLAFARLRARFPAHPLAAGALLGLLAVATLVPFIVAGAARVGGAPATTAGALAALALLPLGGAFALAREARGGALLAGALAVANAYPAIFLLRVRELVPDSTPDPWPIGLALCGIELGAGLALARLLARQG